MPRRDSTARSAPRPSVHRREITKPRALPRLSGAYIHNIVSHLLVLDLTTSVIRLTPYFVLRGGEGKLSDHLLGARYFIVVAAFLIRIHASHPSSPSLSRFASSRWGESGSTDKQTPLTTALMALRHHYRSARRHPRLNNGYRYIPSPRLKIRHETNRNDK